MPLAFSTGDNPVANEQIEDIADGFESSINDLRALKPVIAGMVERYSTDKDFEIDAGSVSDAFQVVLSYLHWLHNDFDLHAESLRKCAGQQGGAS
jgi:hypothetical protein